MKRDITVEEAKVRLETLCARAEHCTGEMYDKLRRWGIAASDADKIVAHLRQARFVDDSRFAAAYVKDKTKFARWGKRKIMQGLYLKHIDRSLIKEALDAIPSDEYTDNLRHVYETKIKNAPSLLDSYEGRTKLYRHALSRGYEPDIAASVLRTMLGGKIS